jgi:uncharacterized protein YbjT (DUF2867 family)
MSARTAIVFGATGLVGGEVLKRLIQHPSYTKIKIFVRRNPGIKDAKVEVHLFDLDHAKEYEHLIYGDDLFCCLGTTIKKAGSQAAFRFVDFEGPRRLAEIASHQGVVSFLVISSLGADEKSSNFYLKTKGEMEEAVKKYKFKNLGIFRPSLLMGERRELRFGELAGKVVMGLAKPFLFGKFKRYRAINGATVAKAMIKVAAENTGCRTYESDEIEILGS